MAHSPDDGAMTRVGGDQFVAKKTIFKLFGEEFYLYGPGGDAKFRVEQEFGRFKEVIHVESQSGAGVDLTIEARNISDFAGVYDVGTADGTPVGVLRRKGLKSIIKDEWEILDTQENVIGTIEEESLASALVSRFMDGIVPQTYDMTLHGELVARFEQHFNPFVLTYDIDFTPDRSGRLDRRLGIAAIATLLTIEGEQE